MSWGVVFALALGALGCHGTAEGAGGCAVVGGFSASWQDNGVGHCATSGSIVETKGSNGIAYTTELALTAYDASGDHFDLIVESLVPGTYSCGGDGGASAVLSYWRSSDKYLPETTQSCSITIPSIGGSGANAAGTFSATLAPADGGADEISNGAFEGPPTLAKPI